jgi:hypothetical protein
MEEAAAQRRARPRLNHYTKALRRERIFARIKLGWTYQRIARAEGVTDRRIRQIVTDALRRQELDGPTDHALIQRMRLESAHELVAQAVDAGDLAAIDPLLKVLERIDRHRKAGMRQALYDAPARKRLFDKLNTVAAGLASEETRAAAEQPNPRGEAPPPEAAPCAPRP